ncbi:rodlin [Streptomyces tropicalis]|uniref:Rodlin n=1 Tax=Streptomyces tropicalis TaxID=3034234 RepID=A0ABT5ZYY4_9ACTN|nr:rodlin [Streptomyces tropicalis]MDF3297587.1 rodlin [Streptomyces tropicalis]
MLKRAMVAAAAAASVVGMTVVAAPTALAIGNDNGPTVANGSGAASSFGNSATNGTMSPQLSLAEGSLNKPCVGVQHVDAGAAAVGVVAQDVPVLSDQMGQQCADNSTQAKRDAALSHLADDLSVLSANGEGA